MWSILSVLLRVKKIVGIRLYRWSRWRHSATLVLLRNLLSSRWPVNWSPATSGDGQSPIFPFSSGFYSSFWMRCGDLYRMRKCCQLRIGFARKLVFCELKKWHLLLKNQIINSVWLNRMHRPSLGLQWSRAAGRRHHDKSSGAREFFQNQKPWPTTLTQSV